MKGQEFPAKVIDGYRITIPTRVRTRLKLRIGDEVDIVITKATPFEKEEEAEG